MSDGILYTVSGGIGRITLNRPDVSNALNLDVSRDLLEAALRAGVDDSVRVVVVDGAGPRFCGGGDLAAMEAAEDRARYVEESALVLDEAIQTVALLEKPVVAAVHGAVAGASLALMLSCDYIIAEESTRFVGAYSSVGFVPDCGLSWLLPRAVGTQRALDMLLTSRPLHSAEALSWGLVSQVVPDGEARARGTELARGFADGPAWALGQIRTLIRSAWSSDRGEAGRREAKTIAEACVTPESDARLKRFLKLDA